MSWSQRLTFGLIAAVALVAGIVSPSLVRADSPPTHTDARNIAVSPAPDASTLGEQNVLDADEFAAVAEITERITPHLYTDEQGLVQLPEDVTADELGVSERFLADFREALRYSNVLIERGEVMVADDLTVSPGENAAAASEAPALDAADIDAPAPQAGFAEQPSEAVPDWGAWGYNSGAMFYNSYQDWNYYRNRYYPLCNTMAAYIRAPWMSGSLVNFYTYNSRSINRYCYRSYGTYYYLPYSYCRSNLAYKPGYFWGLSYGYQSRCGCYGYYWAWQGMWLRY